PRQGAVRQRIAIRIGSDRLIRRRVAVDAEARCEDDQECQHASPRKRPHERPPLTTGTERAPTGQTSERNLRWPVGWDSQYELGSPTPPPARVASAGSTVLAA